jgi:hypothetical protein
MPLKRKGPMSIGGKVDSITYWAKLWAFYISLSSSSPFSSRAHVF